MRRRWFSKRALLLHLLLTIVFPGCLVAAWWQVTVALSGNSLGWLYSVEWPVFSIIAVITWWNLIHDDPGAVGAKGVERIRAEAAAAAEAATTGLIPAHVGRSNPSLFKSARPPVVRRLEEEDPELMAYNNYLASLRRDGDAGRKTWRNPTGGSVAGQTSAS